jgi:hypothetical protein
MKIPNCGKGPHVFTYSASCHGRSHQHEITGLVPERVVDVLEPIEVDEQHSGARLAECRCLRLVVNATGWGLGLREGRSPVDPVAARGRSFTRPFGSAVPPQYLHRGRTDRVPTPADCVPTPTPDQDPDQ